MSEVSMRVVIFTGLPGTGKSVLAERAARILGCPLLSKDIFEAALWRSGIGPELRSGWVAYELMTSIAEDQLRVGQSVVLDSVATYERIRSGWRDLASIHGAASVTISCICSDEAVHRERLAQRQRDIPGWHEINWHHVEDTRRRYEPCTAPQLVLDAVNPLDENLALLYRVLTT